MNKFINSINEEIAPLREEIVNHKVYGVIRDLDSLKIFMQYHVFAVWDFMSLLKSLQNQLTCTTIPWFPKGSANTRFLINEIVVGEESDVDETGNRISHFELYISAMKQAGADVSIITTFIEKLQSSADMDKAFEQAHVPEAARNFVRSTFEVIGSNKDYLQAAAFTFGREDLIPGMFISLIQDINKEFPDSISVFKYYLERHIEVDGDHHSHLAMDMTSELCGTDEHKWKEAHEIIVRSLQARIQLWNGVYDEIIQRNTSDHLRFPSESSSMIS
jgi:hypothetical protein